MQINRISNISSNASAQSIASAANRQLNRVGNAQSTVEFSHQPQTRQAVPLRGELVVGQQSRLFENDLTVLSGQDLLRSQYGNLKPADDLPRPVRNAVNTYLETDHIEDKLMLNEVMGFDAFA